MTPAKKIIFILFLISAFSAFAYEKVPVTLPFKSGGELHTAFYCFNDFAEGEKIASEVFHVKKYKELARGKREKIIPVPLGSRVGYYDWAVFCYGAEFWLFENKNGFLWGRGTLLESPYRE
ncbi:MAG: hypothetical protein IJ727_08860 [Treponema sp.]|nr:hypothetical protein [Treponema sp.]